MYAWCCVAAGDAAVCGSVSSKSRDCVPSHGHDRRHTKTWRDTRDSRAPPPSRLHRHPRATVTRTRGSRVQTSRPPSPRHPSAHTCARVASSRALCPCPPGPPQHPGPRPHCRAQAPQVPVPRSRTDPPLRPAAPARDLPLTHLNARGADMCACAAAGCEQSSSGDATNRGPTPHDPPASPDRHPPPPSNTPRHRHEAGIVHDVSPVSEW